MSVLTLVREILSVAECKISSGNINGARKALVDAIEIVEKANAEELMESEADLLAMEAAFEYGTMVEGRIKV